MAPEAIYTSHKQLWAINVTQLSGSEKQKSYWIADKIVRIITWSDKYRKSIVLLSAAISLIVGPIPSLLNFLNFRVTAHQLRYAFKYIISQEWSILTIKTVASKGSSIALQHKRMVEMTFKSRDVP